MDFTLGSENAIHVDLRRETQVLANKICVRRGTQQGKGAGGSRFELNETHSDVIRSGPQGGYLSLKPNSSCTSMSAAFFRHRRHHQRHPSLTLCKLYVSRKDLRGTGDFPWFADSRFGGPVQSKWWHHQKRLRVAWKLYEADCMSCTEVNEKSFFWQHISAWSGTNLRDVHESCSALQQESTWENQRLNERQKESQDTCLNLCSVSKLRGRFCISVPPPHWDTAVEVDDNEKVVLCASVPKAQCERTRTVSAWIHRWKHDDLKWVSVLMYSKAVLVLRSHIMTTVHFKQEESFIASKQLLSAIDIWPNCSKATTAERGLAHVCCTFTVWKNSPSTTEISQRNPHSVHAAFPYARKNTISWAPCRFMSGDFHTGCCLSSCNPLFCLTCSFFEVNFGHVTILMEVQPSTKNRRVILVLCLSTWGLLRL